MGYSSRACTAKLGVCTAWYKVPGSGSRGYDGRRSPFQRWCLAAIIAGGALNGSWIFSASTPRFDRFEGIVRHGCHCPGFTAVLDASVEPSHPEPGADGHTRKRKRRSRGRVAVIERGRDVGNWCSRLHARSRAHPICLTFPHPLHYRHPSSLPPLS